MTENDIQASAATNESFDDVVAEESTAVVDEQEVEKPTKKSHKKLWMVLGVIIVIVFAAGVGFAVWHEQPSFCNAICHSPMDRYVKGYESNNTSILVSVHASADYSCLDCHKPTLSQQLTEGMAWIKGDFKDPLSTRRFGTKDLCLDCHGSYKDLAAATEDYKGSGRNPHDSHLGEIDCYTCHSMHGTSKLYCVSCHGDMPKPEGW